MSRCHLLRFRFASALFCILLLTICVSTTAASETPPPDIWDGSVAASFAGGSGVESDPYHIANGAQLALVDTYPYAHFKLIADIYLNDPTGWESWTSANGPANVWSPIQDFYGSFDGNGHTIYGLYVSQTSDYAGLFAHIGGIENGTVGVKDLSICQSAVFGKNIAGLLAGGAQRIPVRNCHSNGRVECDGYYISGLIGRSVDSQIYNCTNAATVWNTNNAYTNSGSALRTGGIVGSANSSTMEGCVNTGAISSYGSQVGGVVGHAFTHSALVDCENRGSVAIQAAEGMSPNGVGGIAGSIYDATTISGCKNYAEIQAAAFCVGGIAGQIGVDSFVENCKNFSAVSGTHDAGGVVGSVYDGIVSTCENFGKVTSNETSDAGGITAALHSGIVRNCSNAGNITSPDQNAGGIAGVVFSESRGIINCRNTGTVIGTASVGGIVGNAMSGAIVQNCWSSGAVQSTDSYDCGAIVGRDQDCIVTHCYYTNNDSAKIDDLAKVTEISESYLKSEGFLDELNSWVHANQRPYTNYTNWETDNEGYPAPTGDVFDYIPVTGELTLHQPENGSAVISSLSALTDADVTVTVTANAGYIPHQVWYYTDEDPSVPVYAKETDENTFSFSMPYGDTDVYVSCLQLPPNDVWDGTVADAFAGGDGSENSPYLIGNAGQLALINNNSYNPNEDHYKLIANIYLNDTTGWENWTITDGPNNIWQPFTLYGSLDGNGHTIYGLYTDATKPDQGLFSAWGTSKSDGYIKDLTIDKSKVFGTNRVGALVGSVGTSDSTISNCVNKGDVFASQGYCGGLLGASNGGFIKNCVNFGNISTYTSSAGAGGVVGFVHNVQVENCINNGSVTGLPKEGDEFSGSGVAGIVGSANNSNIFSCINNGEISGSLFVAGICSLLSEYVDTPSDCHLFGNLNNGTITARVSGAAGILAEDVGLVNGTTIIEQCVNTAPISVGDSGDVAGGIIAQLTDGGCTTIQDCYNTGDVSGNADIGGIAGWIRMRDEGGVVTIERCYSAGKVSASRSFSGTVARIEAKAADTSISVRNCYSLSSKASAEVNCSGGAGTETVTNVKSLTAIQMGQQASFEGFDFDTVWYCAGDGTYPKLLAVNDAKQPEEGVSYPQLYVYENKGDTATYSTKLSTVAGGFLERELAFSNSGAAITKDNYTVWCDPAVGSVTWKNDSENKIIWRARATGIEDGATGYIYAYENGKDTEVYALHVTAMARPFKLYNVADDTTPIPMNENGGYTLTYTKGSPTPTVYYFCANDVFTNHEFTPCVFDDNGNSVTVVRGEMINNNTTFAVTIIANYHGNAETSLRLVTDDADCEFNLVIEGSGSSSDAPSDPTPDTPVLPNGWLQMYSQGRNPRETQITRRAGNTYLLNLFYGNSEDARIPNSSKFIFEGELLGSVSLQNGELIWDTRAAYPGMTGYLYTTLNDTTYAISVKVDPAEFGVYTGDTVNPEKVADNYVPKSSEGQYIINYAQKGRVISIVSSRAVSQEGFLITDAYQSAGDSEVYVNRTDTNDIVSVRLPDETSGTQSAAVTLLFELNENGETKSIPRTFDILFTDGSNPGTDDGSTDGDDVGGNTGIVLGTLKRGNNAVGPDDKHQGDLAPYNSISFDVKYGENDEQQATVYMGPSFYFGPVNASFGEFSGHSNGFKNPDQYDLIGLRPVFFTKQGNSYVKVTNEELLQAAQAAVSSYSIDLDVTPGEFEGVYYDEPIEYPTCYNCTFNVTGDVYPGYAYQMKQENRGVYIATLSVTLKDGGTLKSQSIFCWYPTLEDHRYITGENPIEKVNNLLAGMQSVPGRSLMIHLPSGNFSGYLEVPYELRDEGVFFFGNKQTPTVITGGVKGSAVPRNIHFKGAWAGSESIPTTWGDGQLPNQASLPDSEGGYGYVDFRECTLEGYYYALYSNNESVKGATDCTFINNHTAILIDCEPRSAHFRYNYFRNNDTAFEVREIGDVVLGPEQFTGSIFIHNGTDVVNDVEQNIFMPGVFFGYTVGNDVEPRECITNKPDTSNATKKRVFTYPQAANPNRTYSEADKTYKFNEFIYDTGFYASNKGKGPMISSNLSATYPIPAEFLHNGTFRIMDENGCRSIMAYFRVINN